MPEDGNTYLVGYRKPPKHTQFRKGQSGNLRGRRKRKINIGTLLSEELRRQLAFNENGRRSSDCKLSLMIKQVVNKAVAGDFRPLIHLGKLQSWLQAVDDSENVRMIKDTMSLKEAAKRWEETLRSSTEAAGLKC